MRKMHDYGGRTEHLPVPCATCGLPSSHWFPDGSPAWDPHSHATTPTPYYQDDSATLYHADYRDALPLLPDDGLVVMDPPHDDWPSVRAVPGRTVVAFVSWQHRRHVEALYGQPRTELVWTFNTGRWTSHSLPLMTHETILVYGPTGSAYVGEETDGVPIDKGWGSVGRDSYPTRTYTPRDRKALTSHLVYPRDPNAEYGLWQKPLTLVQRLIEWVGPPVVVDPFAGSGTSLVAAKLLGIPSVGVEIEERACEIAANRLRQGVLGLAV